MKPITYTITDFRQTITPNIYKDGVARVEHFDTINGQLRQHATLSASTLSAYGLNISTAKLTDFASLNGTIYALGYDSSASHPAIMKWSAAPNDYYQGHATFGSGASAYGLITYKGALYGLYNGTHIFKCTTGAVITPTHAALTYTNYANPIVHSKDNVAYFFVDNKVYSFDGTTPALALTFPDDFRITCGAEDGDYIFIVGYDSDNKATGFLWDRDPAGTNGELSAKYDLGIDIPYHCAKVGATTFIISQRSDSTNSPVSDKIVLIIRARNGDRAEVVYEYQCDTLSMANNSGVSRLGRFSTGDKFYFSAYVKFKGDTTAKNVILSIDYTGKVQAELNMGVNTAVANRMFGLYKEGDSWWVAGFTDGSWNTVNTYSATSIFETTIMRSDDFSKNMKFVGASFTCEDFPSGGSVTLKARVNNQTSWTTLQTFTTEDAVKFTTNHTTCVNALTGLAQAKQAQFRLEVTGNVIITGFQCVFDPIADERYG